MHRQLVSAIALRWVIMLCAAWLCSGCSSLPTSPSQEGSAGGPASDSLAQVSGGKPNASALASYGYVVRPYFVDEHWRDPKKPNGPEHVVMWFQSSCTMTRPFPAAKLYNGQQQSWLNDWQIWQSRGGGNVSSNCQTYMVFADGWWWYSHKIFISKETLASRFQLAW